MMASGCQWVKVGEEIKPIGEVKLWDAQTGKLKRTFKKVRLDALAPDGKMAACGGTGSTTVRLWDIHTGRVRHTLAGHRAEVKAAAFSPDGKLLASQSVDGIVKLWDARRRRLLHTWRAPRHRHGLHSVGISSSGRSVAISATGRAAANAGSTIKLWSTRTGKLISTLDARAGTVTSVAFSRTGKMLASGSDDGAIRLWDAQNGRLLVSLLILPSPTESGLATTWLAYTPNGYYNGSPGAAKFIRWRVGSQLYPAAQYEKRFHRPDLVQKALQGR